MGRKIACACGKRLLIEDSFKGGAIRCNGCGQLVHVIVETGAGTEPEERPASIPVPGSHTRNKQLRRRARAQSGSMAPWLKLVGAASFVLFCLAVSWRSIKMLTGEAAPAVQIVDTAQHSQVKVAPPRSTVDRDEAPSDFRLTGPRKKRRSAAEGAAEAPGTTEPSGPIRFSGPDGVTITRVDRGPAAAKEDDDDEDKGDSRAAAGVAQLADLIDDVERCVVRLDFVSASGKGNASGFVVDGGGTIVTNYHVVEQVKTMTATFNDKSTLAIEGFKFVVPEKDLAVIQTAPPRRPLRFLRLAKKIPRKGEKVVAFGSPLGLSFSASEGIVSAIRPSKELSEMGMEVQGTWIQMTTQISPGNSGGPLVTTRGEVVGVNTMTLTGGQNLNFAISCEDARGAVEKAKGQTVTALSPERLPRAKGRVKVETDFDESEDVHLAKSDLSAVEASKFKSLMKGVWFGIKWLDVSDFDVRATRGLPNRSGVVIVEVAYRSPAYRAGLKAGDVIRAINGKNAPQSSVVEEMVDDFEPGQSVAITFLRPEAPGRYSNKNVTVKVERLLSQEVVSRVGDSGLPIEVRDFLKRHLMRYYATLADSIKLAGQARNRTLRTRAAAAEGLSVKELRAMSPFDPLFLPSFGVDVPVHVGNIGNLKRVEVLAVVSKKMVVARINRGLIALLADTANFVDGELVTLGTAQICGTVTLQDPDLGAGVKIFVARPFAVDKFLPEVEAAGDDDDDDEEA